MVYLKVIYIYIENNYLYNQLSYNHPAIEPNETFSINVLYNRQDDHGSILYKAPTPQGTLKNFVNCTLENIPFPTLVITDPTQNASVDVEVSGSGEEPK